MIRGKLCHPSKFSCKMTLKIVPLLLAINSPKSCISPLRMKKYKISSYNKPIIIIHILPVRYKRAYLKYICLTEMVRNDDSNEDNFVRKLTILRKFLMIVIGMNSYTAHKSIFDERQDSSDCEKKCLKCE